ncbi:ATP-binding cassette domain-containing protein [Streptococcus hyointestinalis]|nr:ATP-binding cassette domain-containing protein [Streptococcus hyointestinalis]
MAQIEVKQISKAYQDKVIFKDFSLSIHKGEMVAIIGESGRGKTTLLNCLGQLDDVDTGEIVIEGERVTKRNRKKYFREVFGFLFQNFALVDNETVYQNLSFISKDKERITEYLATRGAS